MAEVILSTEDITVLGGPSSISVDVDFGPAGIRGSQIFIGEGNPNEPTTEIGQDDIKVLDLYINLKTDDVDYLYVYQYVTENGINTWKPFFDLVPNTKSINSLATFTAGATTINVPINQIVPSDLVATIAASSFSVQATIQNNLPVALAVEIGTPSGTGSARALPITVNASELSGSTWTALTGPQTVQLLITVV
jgi:hypothetical protein